VENITYLDDVRDAEAERNKKHMIIREGKTMWILLRGREALTGLREQVKNDDEIKLMFLKMLCELDNTIDAKNDLMNTYR